ncbi:MAG: hypothetical protein U9O89_06510 [Thermoproteota archaeon]|nr:hypothetical protein [Thermoproteota archaeon]
MSTTVSIQKPFYFQPPWNILFNFRELERITPWAVNISFLLRSFLEEMEKRGEIDFRASGVAVDSSASIYLRKSKLLLKLEEPPAPPKIREEILLPALSLPLRYELTSTTIQNLLEMLDEALKGEHSLPLKAYLEPPPPSPPEILPQIDRHLMEIEKQMEKFYRSLLQLTKKGATIAFSKIILGLKKLEVVRKFILLLFLAQGGKVNLWQEKDFGEIYITLSEEGTVEGNRAEIV